MNKITTTLILAVMAKITSAQIPSLDATFNAIGYAPVTTSVGAESVRAINQQSDGKIISAYTAGPGSNNYKFYAVRYLSNGTVDNTYGVSGLATATILPQSSEMNDAKLQPDDKLVMVGWTKNASLPNKMAIVRLNTNGTLDNTFAGSGTLPLAFNTFTNGQAYAEAVYIQSDGKILVGGSMVDTSSAFSTNRLIAIARLNSNGIIDNSFGVNGRFILDLTTGYDEVNDITTDAAGNIYAVATRSLGSAIIKLTPAGVVSSAFGVAGVATHSTMTSVANIFVNSTGTQISTGRYQLTANGQLDNSFGTSGYVAGFPRVAIKQPDGKFVGVTSVFTGTTSLLNLQRIDVNGNFDNAFGTSGSYTCPVSTINFASYCINLQSDGKILTGGDKHTTRFSNTITTELSSNEISNRDINIFPNPCTNQFTIKSNASINTIKIINSLGQTVTNNIFETLHNSFDVSNLSSGIYFVVINQTKKIKLVIEK